MKVVARVVDLVALLGTSMVASLGVLLAVDWSEIWKKVYKGE